MATKNNTFGAAVIKTAYASREAQRNRFMRKYGKKINTRYKASEFRFDPVAYITKYLGYKLWHKQEEACRKIMEPPYRVAIRAGHSVGKTFLAACLASWHYDSWNPGICMATAPTKANVRDVFFAELRRIRPDKAGFMPKDTLLATDTEHYVRGLTANTGEALHGRHRRHYGLVFDEAVGIDQKFFEVGLSMFKAIPTHWWLATYNPTDTSSYMYQEESSGNWHIVTMSQLEHPNFTEEMQGKDPPFPEAVRLSQILEAVHSYCSKIDSQAPVDPREINLGKYGRWMPGSQADCRILARWPSAGGDTVWGEYDWTLACQPMELKPQWTTRIGCDVARFGYDDTCIVVARGPAVVYVERHNGWGLNKTMERLKELCEQYKGPQKAREVRVNIDGAGIGAGIVDYADGYNFCDVLSVKPAVREDDYYNTRTELWCNTVELVRNPGNRAVDLSRIPKSELDRLKAECLSVTYDYDPRARKRVVPKSETRALLKRSPDMADALNLAFYLPEKM